MKAYRDACNVIFIETQLAVKRVKETIYYLDFITSELKEQLKLLENVEKSVTNPDSKV